MVKRAFTLIELLVVIAIIAILAAILFPVFAQAKVAAKKTADLSNTKNIATATLMYCSDYDDLFPLQSGRDCGGLWNFNSRVYFPADWNASKNAQPCFKRTQSGFQTPAMEIMPYVKNGDIWAMPGASLATVLTGGDWDYSPANLAKKPMDITYSMNGLMSEMSNTAVASPATTPAWWPGFGKTIYHGYTYTNPFLICADPNQGCVFNGGGPTYGGPGSCNRQDQHTADGVPNGTMSGVGNIDYGTVWCFGKVENWVYTDGHAKSRVTGTGGVKDDPFYDSGNYLKDGIPFQGNLWIDSQCHLPLFRPDRQP